MHLVVVCSRHDMCRSGTHLNISDKVSTRSIKYRKFRIEPLGLIDHRLIFIRPHIVRIVHAVARVRTVVR